MNRYYLSTSHPEIAKGCAEFAAQYARETGKMPDSTVVLDMVAQARLLTKISLDECNGITPRGQRFPTWNDQMQEAADRAREIAQGHVLESTFALFGKGVAVSFQNDPRGAAFCINGKFYIDGGYQ